MNFRSYSSDYSREKKGTQFKREQKVRKVPHEEVSLGLMMKYVKDEFSRQQEWHVQVPERG